MTGRKRHVVVDTLGLVLRTIVHRASIQDRAAVPALLSDIQPSFHRLAHTWLDQGYTGSAVTWITEHLGWTVDIVQHAPAERGEWRYKADATGHLQSTCIRFAPEPTKEFKGVLPRRWVVERTFSWFGQSRRLSNDYERLPETEEAIVYATMVRLMLRSLASA